MIDRLLAGLAERGHQVSLVCGGPIAEHDYEVVSAGGTYSQYLRAPLIGMGRFGQADVVIDVENGFPYFSPLWRRGPLLCLVHHVHTDQWEGHFPRAVAALCRGIEQRVMPAVYKNRIFVAVSKSTADELCTIGVPRAHIRVIESGVDIPPGTPSPKSTEPLFVSLSRLVPHKRVDLMIDAWKLVSDEVPGRLVIAGDGPEMSSLRERASTVPRVELLGRVSEKVKQNLLSEAWGIVSTAHHEGWGMSIMEAAAVGTPALAVDAPGIRDAVVDKVTGVIVRAPEDELICRLAREWVTFASDEALRQALGGAARERAASFSWDRTIDRWQAVLEEVATPEPRKRIMRLTDSEGPNAATVAQLSNRPVEPAVNTAMSDAETSGGIRRSFRLFQGFRTQFDDPQGFYTLLADDTVQLVDKWEPVKGRHVLDIGGGSGYFAAAFRRAGAQSTFVEPFWESMGTPGRQLGYGVIGDGMRLPFASEAFDISHSSNVLEHVTDPRAFLGEMIRVVRPGGLVFLAFTNWLSPFGGHATAPWHYFGGEWSARRYERKAGHPPKPLYGKQLFALHIHQVLSWVRAHPDVDVLDTFPRYYPLWARSVVKVPGLREVATWNLVVVMRRRTQVVGTPSNVAGLA